jgi:hypothetical protein
MDFIMRLTRTQFGYDLFWVIVDRPAKLAHFVPIKRTYTRSQLAELYRSRIVCLYGMSKWIVSVRRTQFISMF